MLGVAFIACSCTKPIDDSPQTPEPQLPAAERFEVFQLLNPTDIPYRIPALAVTKDGTLIAVADYRHSGTDIGVTDKGRIDLHYALSYDNGNTWTDVMPLIEGKGDKSPDFMNVGFGDPCIVADRESNRVLLLSCAGNVSFQNGTRNNHQNIARFYSEDGGKTWSLPEDIAESIYSQFDETRYGPVRSMFVASGRIFQSPTVKVGNYYRLYCAVLIRDKYAKHMNYVLYSDDFGGEWKILGDANTPAVYDTADEPKVEELPDGSILISSRYNGGRYYNMFLFNLSIAQFLPTAKSCDKGRQRSARSSNDRGETMEAFFLKLVNMSITASWLVLAVIAVRFFFKKAPKWILCLLWGFVAFRLICPFSVESKLSLIPDSEPLSQEAVYAPETAKQAHGDILDSEGNLLVSRVPAASGEILDSDGNVIVAIEDGIRTYPEKELEYSWSFYFSKLWLLGFALMLAYTAVSYYLLKRKVSTAVPVKKGIKQSEYVDSPFVLGILRPAIYLPFDIAQGDMEYVIAHEQAHIRRRDHWWKPLGFLLLSIYWFNPVLWVAYILLCRDIEAACDEKVIRDMDKDGCRAYSKALLNCSVHRRRIAACPLAFGEVGVKGSCAVFCTGGCYM